jgi:hypothetical protein
MTKARTLADLTLPSGTPVGTTDTQTLTNKTLTAPTIASANLTTALTIAGAAGSSGNVLTSGGSGAAPSWTTPAGGSWTFLSTVTASNSATVDIETTFDSTYQTYAIVASTVIPVTNAVSLRARQKQSGAYVEDNYQFHLSYNYSTSSSYTGAANGNTTSYLVASDLTNAGNGPENGASFVMYIPNPSNTTLRKTVFSTGVANVGSLGCTQATLAGSNFNSTAALTGIRFFMSSGNISSGTFRLYGIKNS